MVFTLVLVLGDTDKLTGRLGLCTGNSTQLPAAECNAWLAFYQATNGANWTFCSSAATDPCSCCGWGGMCGQGGVTGPTCNSAGTAVTSVILPGGNLAGTLPAVITAWQSLAVLMVNDNQLRGTIPTAFGAEGSWPRLTSFRVDGNHLTGVLPALAFNTTVSDCLLLYHCRWGSNVFDCPWPAGATSVCKKWDYNTSAFDAFVTDADCVQLNTGGDSTRQPVDLLPSSSKV